MDNYQVLQEIAAGAFGAVVKAVNKQSQELVAIKQMKKEYSDWNKCKTMPEFVALITIPPHENIVRLKEIIQEKNQLWLVFEYGGTDILQYYMDQARHGKRVSIDEVIKIFFSILQGLHHMNKYGFFHRDIKPENILYDPNTQMAKICDLGQAKLIRSTQQVYEYCGTRWWRAPEALPKANTCGSPVDIFALACIIVEILQQKPLFPGRTERDQLYQIVSILGTPSDKEWPNGYQLANKMGFRWPQMTKTPLKDVFQRLSPPIYVPLDLIHILEECLQWNPTNRPSAAKLLKDSLFFGMNVSSASQNELPAEDTSHMMSSSTWNQKSMIRNTINNYLNPAKVNEYNRETAHQILQSDRQPSSNMSKHNSHDEYNNHKMNTRNNEKTEFAYNQKQQEHLVQNFVEEDIDDILNKLQAERFNNNASDWKTQRKPSREPRRFYRPGQTQAWNESTIRRASPTWLDEEQESQKKHFAYANDELENPVKIVTLADILEEVNKTDQPQVQQERRRRVYQGQKAKREYHPIDSNHNHSALYGIQAKSTTNRDFSYNQYDYGALPHIDALYDVTLPEAHDYPSRRTIKQGKQVDYMAKSDLSHTNHAYNDYGIHQGVNGAYNQQRNRPLRFAARNALYYS